MFGSVTETTRDTQPVRWKLLVTGLLLIGVLHAICWSVATGQTYKVMFAWGTTLGLITFVLIWWTFLCGLMWSTRWRGLAGLASVIGLAAAAVRIDRIDYYGDTVPIVIWSFR